MKEKVGLEFINRWYTPDLIEKNPHVLEVRFLNGLDQRLTKIDSYNPHYYPADAKRSVLNLGDLNHLDRKSYLSLWNHIRHRMDLESLRVEVGTEIVPNQFDLLVTTPVARSTNHAREAQDRLDEYKEKGTIGFYYRNFNPWGAPSNLRVGSKFFYVDQRAVTGFGVVTNLKVEDITHSLLAKMDADTWRWIDPISCDYESLKPPQGYAYLQKHEYTRHLTSIKVRGGWLEPKPKKCGYISIA